MGKKERQHRQLMEWYRRNQSREVERVVNDDTLTPEAVIDALADIRRWFTADTTLIDSYMTGQVTLAQAIDMLAEPIEESWSSADHGAQYYRQEMMARRQRTYHPADKALQMWGPEEDFPEPESDIGSSDVNSAEGQLWNLWYAIMHAAKRIPWTDDTRHGKLVDLVRALKARPEPPPPARMTVPLRKHWIWEAGALWGNQNMFGPAVSEVSNDVCGCGSGWTQPEQDAWVNVSSFLARLTGGGISDLRSIGDMALHSAMEANLESHTNRHHTAPPIVRLEHHITEASIWMILAGPQLLGEHLGIHRRGEALRVVDDFIHLRGKDLPWRRGRRKYKGPKYEDCWVEFVRRRFEIEAQNAELSEETRHLALKASGRVFEISHAHGQDTRTSRHGGIDEDV